ncbi:Uncharacterised protein [Mycobacterium tuberculosis]|nr:Uncharacterised protein [Mycobacterium tuberculosis]
MHKCNNNDSDHQPSRRARRGADQPGQRATSRPHQVVI